MSTTSTKPLAKALTAALHDQMAADDTVILMGEDIGRLGGVFRVTDGLQDTFGEDRVRIAQNMPDAIEEAVVLAEEDASGELSGVGVLITGSVVTVADARKLLKR